MRSRLNSAKVLDQLSRHKSECNRHGEDVRETLQWLDEATSKNPHVVTLQGADETFEQWTAVEEFAVPRPLFSEKDDEHEHEHEHEHEQDLESTDHLEETVDKFNLTGNNRKLSLSSGPSDASRSLSPSSLRSMHSSSSLMSPPTSPAKVDASPVIRGPSVATAINGRPSSSASVPLRLQPLFNYILWRVHQEIDPVAALESFIFLCNDQDKVKFAKGFDIRTKRLEQLREAIGREDRDYRNRQFVLNRENQNANVTTTETPTSPAKKAGAKFQKSPPQAPAAFSPKPQANVIDPNVFDRGTSQPNTPFEKAPGGPKSPREKNAQMSRGPPRGSPRGSQALPFAPRGNARGNTRGNSRGNMRGRGGQGTLGDRRGSVSMEGAFDIISPSDQIDPDSFSRPEPRGGFRGGRGNRKLWVPTT